MANTTKPTDSVDVEIFGATYTLRGGADPELIRSLAREVDARMRELASPGGAADPLKVAVLAALRLGDDLRASREGSAREESHQVSRIAACGDRLSAIVASGSAASDAQRRA